MPLTILMGQPNTCKTLLAKVAAAIVGGMHRTAIFSELSTAHLNHLLGRSLFFVLNDPGATEVLNKGHNKGMFFTNCIYIIFQNSIVRL